MLAIQNRRAFSLIELVIVIVIIAIIGAIAIPRMSRGTAGAADSALTANLAVLRNAIDLFHTEHGGVYPKLDQLADRLLGYTNEAGDPNSPDPNVRDAAHPYGPYLRAIPPLPVGSNKGSTAFTGTMGGTAGWYYNETTGDVRANLPDTETDVRGKSYNKY